jgi:hypothetical protein
MKKKKEKDMKQVREPKAKENEDPRTREDLEEFTSPEDESRDRIKTFSMNPYHDDLL